MRGRGMPRGLIPDSVKRYKSTGFAGCSTERSVNAGHSFHDTRGDAASDSERNVQLEAAEPLPPPPPLSPPGDRSRALEEMLVINNKRRKEEEDREEMLYMGADFDVGRDEPFSEPEKQKFTPLMGGTAKRLSLRLDSSTLKYRERLKLMWSDVGALAPRCMSRQELRRLAWFSVVALLGFWAWSMILSSLLGPEYSASSLFDSTTMSSIKVRISSAATTNEWIDPTEGSDVRFSPLARNNHFQHKQHYKDGEIERDSDNFSPMFPERNPLIQVAGQQGLGDGEKNYDPFKPRVLPQTRWPIRVAIFRGKGASIRSWTNIKHLLKCANNTIDARVIKNANLATVNRANFDVFLIPGGEAGEMNEWHTAHGSNLRKTVRSFVRSGGGYVGICAGAYLGRGPFQLSPFRKASTTLGVGWFKSGDLSPWFEQATQELWPISKSSFDNHLLYYANGPIFQELRDFPITNPEISNPRVIMRAGQKSFLHIEHGPVPGTKAHTFGTRYSGLPLATFNEYANGKVLLSTVHPETNATKGIHSFEVTPTECNSPHGNFIVDLVLMAANRTGVPILL